jgi:hypothetical protein
MISAEHLINMAMWGTFIFHVTDSLVKVEGLLLSDMRIKETLKTHWMQWMGQ